LTPLATAGYKTKECGISLEEILIIIIIINLFVKKRPFSKTSVLMFQLDKGADKKKYSTAQKAIVSV